MSFDLYYPQRKPVTETNASFQTFNRVLVVALSIAEMLIASPGHRNPRYWTNLFKYSTLTPGELKTDVASTYTPLSYCVMYICAFIYTIR